MVQKFSQALILLLLWFGASSSNSGLSVFIGGSAAYAQPAALIDTSYGSSVMPADNEGSGDEPQREEEEEESPSLWIKTMPDHLSWAIGLGSFFAFLLVVYALYRALLPRHVARINPPVALRANLIMLCGLVFILWHSYWFVWHLEAFGILTAAVLAAAGLAIVIIGVLSRR